MSGGLPSGLSVHVMRVAAGSVVVGFAVLAAREGGRCRVCVACVSRVCRVCVARRRTPARRPCQRTAHCPCRLAWQPRSNQAAGGHRSALTRAHTHAHSHTRTRTHERTHERTHTHTHTRTHRTTHAHRPTQGCCTRRGTVGLIGCSSRVGSGTGLIIAQHFLQALQFFGIFQSPELRPK